MYLGPLPEGIPAKEAKHVQQNMAPPQAKVPPVTVNNAELDDPLKANHQQVEMEPDTALNPEQDEGGESHAVAIESDGKFEPEAKDEATIKNSEGHFECEDQSRIDLKDTKGDIKAAEIDDTNVDLPHNSTSMLKDSEGSLVDDDKVDDDKSNGGLNPSEGDLADDEQEKSNSSLKESEHTLLYKEKDESKGACNANGGLLLDKEMDKSIHNLDVTEVTAGNKVDANDNIVKTLKVKIEDIGETSDTDSTWVPPRPEFSPTELQRKIDGHKETDAVQDIKKGNVEHDVQQSDKEHSRKRKRRSALVTRRDDTKPLKLPRKPKGYGYTCLPNVRAKFSPEQLQKNRDLAMRNKELLQSLKEKKKKKDSKPQVKQDTLERNMIENIVKSRKEISQTEIELQAIYALKEGQRSNLEQLADLALEGEESRM